MMNRLGTAIATSALLAAGPAGAQDAPAWATEAHRLAAPLVDSGLIPGVAIGTYDKGETEFIGIGSVRFQQDDPPTAQTVYEIGSISKAFTGLLLADAVGRGEVTLDTTVASLAPEGVTVPEWSAPSRVPRAYTLLDLATHTSGLPRMPADFDPADPSDPYAAYDEDALWASVSNTAPATEPGSAYAYSNFATGLLGTVLADNANESFEQLLRVRLAEPLGMADTTITLSPGQAERLAPAHTPFGPVTSNWAFGSLAGCGAVRSTVADMLMLIGAIVEPPSDAFEQTARLALQRHRAAPGGPATGLAWHLAGDGVTRWHNGQTGGYASMLLVNRASQRGVVLLCNAAAPEAQAVAERLFQAMHGIAVAPPAVRAPVELPAGSLGRLAGRYDGPHGLVYTFTIEGGRLSARLTGQPALTVYPESAARFFYRDVPADLAFELPDGTDPASGVTLYQNGQELVFTRQAD